MDLDQTQAILDKRYVTHISAPISGLFILLSMLFLYVYRDTLFYLLNDWTQLQSGEYAHGFAVIAVAVFMVWGRRESLSQTVIRPNLLGISLVAGFSITWMIGILIGVRVVESMSFFLLIPSLIFTLTGRQFVTRLWFPLAFILVAFPVWELFLPYLQSVATTISYFFLRLTGTTVIREDAYLIVPAGKFLVADGCSGLRYLLAAMTFGGFYIYLESLTRWRAAVFFGIVVFAAILANALRITAVIIAGNLTEMQHPWVHDHLMLGWYIFAAMLVPVFFLGNKFGDAEQVIKKKVSIRKSHLFNEKASSYSMLLPILVIALMTGPTLKNLLLSRAQSSLNSDLELLVPAGQNGWKPLIESSYGNRENLQPNYEGADNIVDQYYSDSEKRVRLYVALYQQQKQDKELINVNNHLYDEEQWQAVESQVLSPKNSDHQFVEVQLKNNAGGKRLMWYWYRTAGHTTTRAVFTKLLDLYGMVTGQNSSSVIMMSTSFKDGRDQARNDLGRFYAAMNKQVDQQLDAMNNR